MSWQLWVVIALAASGPVLLAVIRLRHARHVFDDITRLDRPSQRSRSTAGRPPGLADRHGSGVRPHLAGDELAQVRTRRPGPGDQPAHGPRRKHG